MRKSELVKLVQEELKGYSPQIGPTKGLTSDTLNRILTKIAKGDDEEENLDEGKGLDLASKIIELSRKAMKNLSDEDLDEFRKEIALAFDLKTEVTTENSSEWPKEILSRHKDIVFRLVRERGGRAKYELIDVNTGEEFEAGGRVYGSVQSLLDDAENTIMPSGGRQSSQF